jgi:hypothetical protein
LGSQGYRGDLIAKDEYGQDYNVGEINLEDFKDRLKTKKSGFTNTTRAQTYGELAIQLAKNPTVGDRMWDAYSKTKFDDQYQIGKKYRERNAEEIAQEKTNAEEMYDLLNKDESLDKTDKGMKNLMYTVHNLTRRIPKHEKNCYYDSRPIQTFLQDSSGGRTQAENQPQASVLQLHTSQFEN